MISLLSKLLNTYRKSYWAVLSATSVIAEQNAYIYKLEADVQRLEGDVEKLCDALEQALCGIRYHD